MESRTPRALKRLVTRRRAFIFALLCAALAAASAALASSSSGPSRSSGVDGANAVPTIQVNGLHSTAGGGAKSPPLAPMAAHVLDMSRLGIHPTPFRHAPQLAPQPAGGAVGTFNAYMSSSADLVAPSTATAYGAIVSGFTASETINYYLNGTFAGSNTADGNGRAAVTINTGAGQGYITLEAIGQTSAKRAGGVAEVVTPTPASPGLAVAPHAINPTGSSNIYLMGTRYPAGTVTLARNGVTVGTATANAAGFFYVSVPVAAGADTSAVYSAYTASGLNGQTEEERADAGTPPAGDNNLARVLVDRPITASSTGGAMSVVGEGFQAGETVNISSCATAAFAANANGAVPFFLSVGAGTGTAQCVLTGATSGRVARMTYQGDPNVINTPSAINAPATLPAESVNFLFLFDRLAPSQTGTVFDGHGVPVSVDEGRQRPPGHDHRREPVSDRPQSHVLGRPRPAARLPGWSERDRHVRRWRLQPGRRLLQPDARRRGRGRASRQHHPDLPGELRAGQLRDRRHVPRTGACAERAGQPVHVRRRQPERDLEPLHRGRRRR